MSILRRISERLRSITITNYLGYALGEVILVVIGILLALQINNWNEARKDKALEEVYYCKLLEDLNLDVALMNDLIKDNQLRIASANEMLVLIQTPHPDVRALMNAMRGSTSRTTYTFRASKAAFEDIQSSGHLSLLDAEIKDHLIRYYASMAGFENVVNVNSDASVNLYYYPERDMADIGWQYLPKLRMELDSTRVDLKKLDDPHYPSPAVRKQLTSDAIFYVGTNARKKELYNQMAEEIGRMQSILQQRCKR
ncbi:MAG TPA: DUF6090 family protein [Cyclobacteriaceae bacterium]|nr:DUF6090 family protein [Cyclobacteriaceae bacterium]